ncbi:MAG: hypothetical protein AABY64_06590 [Bdellovibrionota bacterium]
MKELIGAVFLVVSLFAGTHYLKQIHDNVRRKAITKASQGLPSLVKMNEATTGEKSPRKLKWKP